LITNLVWRLLEQPARWAALRSDPALVGAAIEESLRFDPPVLGLFRTTTRDVELHGVEIPRGAKVMLHYAAANRDPEVFSDPDRFRLDRPRSEASEHLSFGLGIHFCLGAALARLEAETAIRALLEWFPRLSLEGPGERIAPFFLWGRRRLPLHIGA
jgi:cytochrome P450